MSPTDHELRPLLLHPAEDDEFVIQDWNQRVKSNGPLCPGPTIQQARTAQYDWLIVDCAGCGRIAHLPFELIRRAPATPIADLLPALICTRCGQKGPPAAKIRGVATHTDDSLPAIHIPPADEE
jgi:hypothetical protein